MQILLILAMYLLCALNITAQTPKKYVVKAGEIPAEVLPAEAKFALPAFTAGTAFLRDGSFSNQQFNYNLLLDEMEFIGSKADTLGIADPALIRNIVVDSLVFYFDKMYVKEVFKKDSFKLAERQILVQAFDKTLGGYEMGMGASSITTYGSINSNSFRYRLQLKREMIFQKAFSYFLGDRFNHFVKADKKSFLNIFSLKRTQIQNYLKKNEINFNVKEDLQKLLIFCLDDTKD